MTQQRRVCHQCPFDFAPANDPASQAREAGLLPMVVDLCHFPFAVDSFADVRDVTRRQFATI